MDRRRRWVPPGLAQLFETVLDAADRGHLDGLERRAFHDAGVAAADDGGSLSLLIDAYLRGAGELWEHLFTETTGTAPTVELSRILRQISEEAVAALAEGFEDAQRRHIRAEENTRRELIDTLLGGQDMHSAWFAERAAVVGFPSEGPYRVSVAGSDDVLGDDDRAQALVQRYLETRAGRGRWVSLIRRGHVVVIGARGDPDDVVDLASVLAAEALPGTWHVGIGDRHDGPEGIRSSYVEALEALHIGRTFGLPSPAVHADLLVERLLRNERSIVAELHERVVVPLAATTRGDLLDTLEAFLRSGGNMADAARRLSVGTRTVGYRLDRVEEVTGYAPRDPDDRLLLELALRSRPLASAAVPGSASRDPRFADT